MSDNTTGNHHYNHSGRHNNRRLELSSIPNVPLQDLPLRPSALQWWHQKGFRSTMEVQQGLQIHAAGSMIQWAQDLGVDNVDNNNKSVGFLARLYREVQTCLETYVDERQSTTMTTTAAHNSRTLGGPLFIRGQSAAALIQELEASQRQPNQKKEIISFCQQVDQLLGGGIALGELTEIAGPPGIGKTQWAMQLAVNVQLPDFFGGLEGRAIYIDTEGSLTPERCHDMAQHLVHHVTSKLRALPNKGPPPPWFTVEGLLEGIQVLRVYDVATLDATLSSLEQLCQQQNANRRSVRLVIVDSLAFPVRSESCDFIERTQQLTKWAMKLSQLAQSSPPKAVVVLNQMTTKSTSSSSASSYSAESTTLRNKENSNALFADRMLTPALGEAWAHAVTNRVVLAHHHGTNNNNNNSGSWDEARIFRLVKSPRLPSGQAEYAIVEGGIRDIRVARSLNSNKRPRLSDVS